VVCGSISGLTRPQVNPDQRIFMLKTLRIKNLAVVDDVTLSFEEGLNVLTGSTGAGKSLILGAVNLLLGERGSASVIRVGEDKAVIEGEFVTAAPQIDKLLFAAGGGNRVLLRREVHRNGRSHAFVAGKPSTLKQLQEVSRELIEPHGQNEQLQLKYAENHLVYVDRFADNGRSLNAYRSALSSYREAEQSLQAFERRMTLLKEKKELLEHRIEELERAAIKTGERDTLEKNIQVLENAQDIFDALNSASNTLYEGEPSAFEAVSQERGRVAKIASLDKRFAQMAEQLENAEILIKETAADMRTYLDGFDFEPGRLEALQERLSFLIGLERRYGKPLVEIVEEQCQWKQELGSIAFEDDERKSLTAGVDEALKVVKSAALDVSDQRRKAAAKLDRSMTSELGQLMMKGAHFRTDIAYEPEAGSRLVLDGTPVRLGPDGIDTVVFHVRTNPGEAEGALTDVASSGELSRIALALKKNVSAGREGSVLVFDELDAGVGADLGDMISDKLAGLAEHYQIICITHMPQIAARGRRHLVVRKDNARGRTFARVDDVTGDERLGEIARMLGGSQGSEKRLALAAEMLKIQGKSSPRVRP
jgi:DNA repair protein RecN (Recombination protein N)